MLTRLQLANGYVNGTLTDEELEVAESNPLVMNQVETLKRSAIKPNTERKTKNARLKTR